KQDLHIFCGLKAKKHTYFQEICSILHRFLHLSPDFGAGAPETGQKICKKPKKKRDLHIFNFFTQIHLMVIEEQVDSPVIKWYLHICRNSI
ncbi:MAG: hypothetical protein Q4A48_03995, partial [Bacillota bacterium]|nr:hypothetical protein [Bacillota bacterium]